MSILEEGYPFIFPAFAAGLIFLIISRFTEKPADIVCIAIGSLLIIFALFCMYFFRDPAIKVTQEEGAILSPCNGTVMELTEEDG
jgi:phosphatidylserine decarboxylase